MLMEKLQVKSVPWRKKRLYGPKNPAIADGVVYMRFYWEIDGEHLLPRRGGVGTLESEPDSSD